MSDAVSPEAQEAARTWLIKNCVCECPERDLATLLQSIKDQGFNEGIDAVLALDQNYKSKGSLHIGGAAYRAIAKLKRGEP